jgi:hypothetical protein
LLRDPQPLAQMVGRNVKGKDALVYIHRNVVVVTFVDARLTPADLQEEPFRSPFHFIRNRNLHALPSGLRGVICYASGVVGVIVKALGGKAILLPVPGPFKLISFC